MEPYLNLVCADCLQYLKDMQAGQVSVVVTSPPYNLGTKYKTYPDKFPRDEYLSFLKCVFTELRRVMRDDAHFFLNVGFSGKDPWVAMDVAMAARDLFVLQNQICWVKSVTIDNSYGHFKPINSKRYLNNCFEHLFHFTKSGNVEVERLAIGVPYKDKSNCSRWKKASSGIRCRGNVWYIPYTTIQRTSEKGNHPAIFPEVLVEYCLKLAGAHSDTLVLDPFSGVGTTLTVCKRMNVPAIGIELDQAYVDYAKQMLDL
jgi:site-specific DNA-methyltransferase (adenine-specific)